MASPGNVDLQEIERFDKLSQIWWEPKGEMGTLHTINPLRVRFITQNNTTLSGLRVLDIGCGGGILTEALAKEGARVTGIDLSQTSILIARRHAERGGLNIDYHHTNVEDFTQEHAESFDIVTCMEMLEHVPEADKIIGACAQALKPGGQAYFSTINRTPKAYLFDILIGEYVLHLLPKGSHQYHRLIRPQELKEWTSKHNLAFIRIASLIYNPISRKFKLVVHREDVNYMAQFIKRS